MYCRHPREHKVEPAQVASNEARIAGSSSAWRMKGSADYPIIGPVKDPAHCTQVAMQNTHGAAIGKLAAWVGVPRFDEFRIGLADDASSSALTLFLLIPDSSVRISFYCYFGC